MAASQRSTVVGVFEDLGHAEKAARELRDAWFPVERIGFAVRDRAADGGAPRTGGTDAAASTIAGGVTGTVAGGLLGGVLGAAVSAAIPGIGPVIGAGVLAMILGGAYVGGIAGALIAMGIPEEEARYYQQEFEAGRAIVTVQADGRYPEAHAILTVNGAYDVTRQATPVNAPV